MTRPGKWVSIKEERGSFRTEHFRCVDSLGLLLRNRTITAAMHDAGQEFARAFVAAQLQASGAPPLDGLPRGCWRDSVTERSAGVRKRAGDALDAVGGIASPGGCVLWQVAGLGRSVKEWCETHGWNEQPLNERVGKGILVAALGVRVVFCGLAR